MTSKENTQYIINIRAGCDWDPRVYSTWSDVLEMTPTHTSSTTKLEIDIEFLRKNPFFSGDQDLLLRLERALYIIKAHNFSIRVAFNLIGSFTLFSFLVESRVRDQEYKSWGWCHKHDFKAFIESLEATAEEVDGLVLQQTLDANQETLEELKEDLRASVGGGLYTLHTEVLDRRNVRKFKSIPVKS